MMRNNLTDLIKLPKRVLDSNAVRTDEGEEMSNDPEMVYTNDSHIGRDINIITNLWHAIIQKAKFFIVAKGICVCQSMERNFLHQVLKRLLLYSSHLPTSIPRKLRELIMCCHVKE